MRIQKEDYALTISDQLITTLQTEIAKPNINKSSGIILSFKDSNYSAESGGYHPVEICIDQKGINQYVTDFAYVGSAPYAELAKELDFDFSLGLLQQFEREYPIAQAYELFGIWQQNFCAYYLQGIYQITVTPC